MVNDYELLNDDDETAMEWEASERTEENQASLLGRI